MLNATPFLRIYSKIRYSKLNNLNHSSCQEQQLLKLVSKAKNTKFGFAHGFKSIRSIKDYQKQVPLRSYEAFWNEYWKPNFPKLDNCTWPGIIPYFAVSSGTTSGKTKYIPLSAEMIKSNVQGGLDLLSHHMHNRPSSQIFGGKSFVLGGSTELVEESPGIFSGDLSGIAVKTLPWWAAMRYFPPKQLALLKNWEEKIEKLSNGSLTQDIRMISGVPSWMLIFFKKLWDINPETYGSLANVYKNLEMLVHGGVNFAPYYKQFTDILKDTRAELREVYPASEGFIAVADRNYGEGMRVIPDHGIFFEFVPLEELNSPTPTRHWIQDIQPDINYAIVLTTCAGLWSYILGDTVKFVDTKIPRLLVTGRTAYFLSAFGEHLAGEEIEFAVSTACQNINLNVVDYSVGAIYPAHSGELGGHLFVMEFDDRDPTASELKILIEKITKYLCERNDDYDAHRASGYGLRPPEILVAKRGAFAAWMKSRGKLGGQNKVPRIINDQDLFSGLQKFVKGF